MAKRKARRKNRKIKFSEQNYVEKNYLRYGKAIIPIKLDKIEDLYMKHDYKHMELSDSVCDYIEEIAYIIPLQNDIVLEIHCPEIDEETQKRAKKAIKNNYGMEIDDNDYDIRMANKKSIILAIVGIILLITECLLGKYLGNVLANFLCVVWWVAIWDMLELQFFENAQSKLQRLNNLQLYDSTIEFVFDEETKNKEKQETEVKTV